MAKKSKKTTRKSTTSRKKSAKKGSRSTAKKRKSSAKKKSTTKSRKKTAKKSTAKTTKKTSRRKQSGSGKRKSTKKSSAKKTSKKPKSPLTKAELKEFRKRLVEKRRDILGDMGGMQSGHAGVNPEEGISAAPSMPTHPADVGSDNFEHEFNLGLLQSERALLQEIDEALERINKGTYGICLGTGDPINKARLRARPWAKYCIEYARMVEKGLVRPSEEQQNNTSQDEDEDLLDEEEELEETEDEDASADVEPDEIVDEDED
ncbi:MAG: TraR/DksA family transcriptional regulator [Planctomycetota bacterium]